MPKRTHRQGFNYEYLLPLKDLFFEFFPAHDISKVVEIVEKTEEYLTVRLNLESTSGEKLVLEKIYTANVSNTQKNGKIINLQDEINLNIGIFPFYKVKSGDLYSNEHNDWYKVMLIMEDHTRSFENKNFNLSFYRNDSSVETTTDWRIISENSSEKSVKRLDRSLLADNKIGSTYFTLKNTWFDYIRIKLPIIYNGTSVNAIIAPKWLDKNLGTKSFNIAIDLGTTNTFIALAEDLDSSPQPFEITEKDIQVVMLHKPSDDKDSKDIDRYEKYFGFDDSTILQRHEFIPSLIGSQKYSFPIRTSLFEKENAEQNGFELLSNINVAFSYYKEPITNLKKDNIRAIQKWQVTSRSSDSIHKVYAELFLTELLQLVKNKVILNDGNPALSNLIWFSPLSFTPQAKSEYSKIWKKLFEKVLKSRANLTNITESEAPFYFYDKGGDVKNSECVLTIDIGGGSTDFMISLDHSPKYGTSVNFAGNALWGNGYSELKTDQKNGIFLDLQDDISDRLTKSSLNETYQKIVRTDGTIELINFWLTNEVSTGASELLNSGKFKLMYLLHLNALLYHVAQLMFSKNSPAPTCIIFSGNGSKYVDFIQIEQLNVIGKISSHIFGTIFGTAIQIPQVILPEKNRKESTSFGGIYKTSKSEPDSVVYIGENITYSDGYKRYKDIDTKKDFVEKSITKNVEQCINILFELNEIIPFKRTFGIDISLEPVKKYLLQEIEVNYKQGYKRRRKDVQDDDEITEPLFFYPFFGLLFDLSKINSREIVEIKVSEESLMYFSNVSASGVIKAPSTQKSHDSIFFLTLNEENSNSAIVSIIDSKQASEKAMRSIDNYIVPVCAFDEYPLSNQTPKLLESGVAEKIDNTWHIVKKVKVEFI